MSVLARRADPGVSATLLDAPGVWEAALHHVWDDGGAALGDVVAQAGREPGALGDRVVHTGLATAGEGLAGNEPSGWTVNRDTLAAIAPALGDAVSGHVAVAVEALQVGVDGRPGGDRLNVLAGLGYVTLDRGAAAAIEQALSGWAGIDPVALVGTAPGAPLPAVAVLGAYVAVQEFAQRASHALDAWEDRELAEAKKAVWQHSVHLLPEILPGYWGILGGLAEGYASIAADTDGTWVDRPDRGLVFDRDDAAAVAVAALAPRDASAVRAVTGQAAAAFDRTAAVLGERTAPTSPETDWLGPAEDLSIDVQNARMESGKDWTRFPRFHPPTAG